MLKTLLHHWQKAWHDPVWSRIISAAILGIPAVLYGGYLLLAPRFADSERPAHGVSEEVKWRTFVIPSCDKSRDPRRLYDTARELPSQEAREAEVSNLVVDAICQGEEQFALELFLRLTSPDRKDSAARRVVAILSGDGKFPEARKWASYLTKQEDKEFWLRQILDDASRRKG